MDVALSQFFCTAYKLARAANLPLPWRPNLFHFVTSSRIKVQLSVPRVFFRTLLTAGEYS